MSKKKKKSVPVNMPKKESNVIWHRDSVKNTLDHMPRYNGFAVGSGFQKSDRHPSRNKRKAELKQLLKDY